jgi:hypothetical protein
VLGINDGTYRVTRISYGDPLDNQVQVDATEDIFSTPFATFSDPILSSWSRPQLFVAPLAAADAIVQENNWLLTYLDEGTSTFGHRGMFFLRKTSGAATEFEIYVDDKYGTGSFPNDFEFDSSGVSFMLCGTLRNNLQGPPTDALPSQGVASIEVESLDTLASLVQTVDFTAEQLEAGSGLIYVGDETSGEFISYTRARLPTASPTFSGLELEKVYRGCCDTVPKQFPAGTRVWFLATGGLHNTTGTWFGPSGSAGLPSEDPSNDARVRFKIAPRSTTDSVLLTDSPGPLVEPDSGEIDLSRRLGRPPAPSEWYLNDVRYPTTVNADTNVAAGLTGASPLPYTPGIKVQVTRRYRFATGVLADVEGRLTASGTTKYNPQTDTLIDEYRVRWWLYDWTTSPLPSSRGDAILSGETDYDTFNNDTFYILRSDIIAAAGGVPTTMRLEIDAAINDGNTTSPSIYPAYESWEPMTYQFDVTSDVQTATDLGTVAFNAATSTLDLSALSPQVTTARLELSHSLGDSMTFNNQEYPGSFFFRDAAASPLVWEQIISPSKPVTSATHQDLDAYKRSQTFTVPASGQMDFKVRQWQGRPVDFEIYNNDTDELVAYGTANPFSTLGTALTWEDEPIYLGKLDGRQDAKNLADIVTPPDGVILTLPSDWGVGESLTLDLYNSSTLDTIDTNPTPNSPLDGDSYGTGVWYNYRPALGGSSMIKTPVAASTVTDIALPAADPDTGIQHSNFQAGDQLQFALNIAHLDTGIQEDAKILALRRSSTNKVFAFANVVQGTQVGPTFGAGTIEQGSPAIPPGTNESPIQFPTTPSGDVGHQAILVSGLAQIVIAPATGNFWGGSPDFEMWVYTSTLGWYKVYDKGGPSGSTPGRVVTPFSTSDLKIYYTGTNLANRSIDFYTFAGWRDGQGVSQQFIGRVILSG